MRSSQCLAPFSQSSFLVDIGMFPSSSNAIKSAHAPPRILIVRKYGSESNGPSVFSVVMWA